MAPHARRRPSPDATAVKVVITGPVGAGKTTLISTISTGGALATERVATDDGTGARQRTTVALDVGRLPIDHDLALCLFGTPGRERFAFMRPMLAEGMLGLVLLVDAGREDRYVAAASMLRAYLDEVTVPYVVAVNRCSEATDLSVVRRHLDVPESVPVIAVDARDRESVKGVLLALLLAVLAEIEALEPTCT